MLEICGINKTFNPGTINANHALKDLSLHLAEGQSIAVIGGNGAGKSTLLNAVAGVWSVDSGSIKLGGIDITHLPEYKRAKYIGRVFQDPMMGTAANMQIEENLALAARRGGRRSLRMGITKGEREVFSTIWISSPRTSSITMISWSSLPMLAPWPVPVLSPLRSIWVWPSWINAVRRPMSARL